MSSTEIYLEQAEFAFAAYANFVPGMTNAAYEAALRDDGNGMAAEQAALFAATYAVAAQYTDATGLSATVFADAAGNKYLAIRGTNDGLDLAADVGITLRDGINASDAAQQIADAARQQTGKGGASIIQAMHQTRELKPATHC